MHESTELIHQTPLAAMLGVHPKTLDRWSKDPSVKFPPPIKINGRKYRALKKVRAWMAARAAKAA